MRNTLLALSAAVIATLILSGCGKKEEAPPASAATAAPAANAEPAEGAPRIAISPDGVHVQYRVYGSGEPTLVFIHGWSCDSNYWREQVPVFKQHYSVVTVDLAGHGGTDGNRTEWTIRNFGQDVATALSAVPSEQIILVGHSMGGPVAIEAARKLGKRVIGIIGVDTFNSVGAPAPGKAQVDALLKAFEADYIGQTRKFVTEHLFAPTANHELANKVAYDMSLSPPRVAIPSLRAVLEYDYTEPLQEVSVPIVAIDSDLGEPVNEARIRKVLPKFHATIITGVGHFLMMEDPARFNAALETEIQALRNPAGS
jgi:pimeloyl-ACP methyl ester carboxylesterase